MPGCLDLIVEWSRYGEKIFELFLLISSVKLKCQTLAIIARPSPVSITSEAFCDQVASRPHAGIPKQSDIGPRNGDAADLVSSCVMGIVSPSVAFL